MDSQSFNQSFCISSSSPLLCLSPSPLAMGAESPKRQRAGSKPSPHETEEMELYVSLCCLINRNLMDKDWVQGVHACQRAWGPEHMHAVKQAGRLMHTHTHGDTYTHSNWCSFSIAHRCTLTHTHAAKCSRTSCEKATSWIANAVNSVDYRIQADFTLIQTEMIIHWLLNYTASGGRGGVCRRELEYFIEGSWDQSIEEDITLYKPLCVSSV